MVYVSGLNAENVIWRKEYKIESREYDKAVLEYFKTHSLSNFYAKYKSRVDKKNKAAKK